MKTFRALLLIIIVFLISSCGEYLFSTVNPKAVKLIKRQAWDCNAEPSELLSIIETNFDFDYDWEYNGRGFYGFDGEFVNMGVCEDFCNLLNSLFHQLNYKYPYCMHHIYTQGRTAHDVLSEWGMSEAEIKRKFPIDVSAGHYTFIYQYRGQYVFIDYGDWGYLDGATTLSQAKQLYWELRNG